MLYPAKFYVIQTIPWGTIWYQHDRGLGDTNLVSRFLITNRLSRTRVKTGEHRIICALSLIVRTHDTMFTSTDIPGYGILTFVAGSFETTSHCLFTVLTKPDGISLVQRDISRSSSQTTCTNISWTNFLEPREKVLVRQVSVGQGQTLGIDRIV